MSGAAPTEDLTWAESAPGYGIVEPTTKRVAGWVAGDKPPAEWLNYWMRGVGRMRTYYGDKNVAGGIVGLHDTDASASWAATAGSAAGLSVTGHGTGAGGVFAGGASGHGVSGTGAGSGAGGVFAGGASGHGVSGTGAGSGAGGVFAGGASGHGGVFTAGTAAGARYGVSASTQAVSGAGVYATNANSPSASGLLDEAHGAAIVGVAGDNANLKGVIGRAGTGTGSIGVLAQSSASAAVAIYAYTTGGQGIVAYVNNAAPPYAPLQIVPGNAPSVTSSVYRGSVYYDTSTNKLRVLTNSGWTDLH